jgi:hypothetical protein
MARLARKRLSPRIGLSRGAAGEPSCPTAGAPSVPAVAERRKGPQPQTGANTHTSETTRSGNAIQRDHSGGWLVTLAITKLTKYRDAIPATTAQAFCHRAWSPTRHRRTPLYGNRSVCHCILQHSIMYYRLISAISV